MGWSNRGLWGEVEVVVWGNRIGECTCIHLPVSASVRVGFMGGVVGFKGGVGPGWGEVE